MNNKEFYGNIIIRGFVIGYGAGKFFASSLFDDSIKYFRTENEAIEFAKSN